MKFDASLALQQRFNQVIPGGSHTYEILKVKF